MAASSSLSCSSRPQSPHRTASVHPPDATTGASLELETSSSLLPDAADAVATATPTQATSSDVESHTSTSHDAAPPPLTFIDIDPNQRFPRPSSPPVCDDEALKTAEELVHWAISSKHENAVDDTAHDGGGGIPPNVLRAARAHRDLAELLRRKASAGALVAALRALVSSNAGSALDRLVTHPRAHRQLIHLLLRFDPFAPPSDGTAPLRDLDRLWRERAAARAAAPRPSAGGTGAPRRPSVQIAEAALRHKEDARHVAPLRPYFRHRVVDAHLRLLLALVSNNALLIPSAVRGCWALLTDFGAKWTEWGAADMRRRRILRGRGQETGGGEDGGGAPEAKRRRIAVEISASPSPSPSHVAEFQEDVTPEPEDERPVPGMGGLSAGFVREAFYGDDGQHDDHREAKGLGEDEEDCDAAREAEDIYPDRLASGRVHRLLLTLVNIFRLSPRSKTDLLQQLTQNFPHYKTCHPMLLKWYLHMCLQMVHLFSTLEGPVLTLIIDKALDMDVEIKIGAGGMVSLDASSRDDDCSDRVENRNEGQPSFESGAVRSLPFTSSDVHAEAATATGKRSFHQISNDSLVSLTSTAKECISAVAAGEMEESHYIFEISERLDTLMTHLCAHIVRATKYEPNSLSQALGAVVRARRLYRNLDSVFDTKVRTTYRSKIVQFVFLVLFGRENDALDTVGRLMAQREEQQQKMQFQQGSTDNMAHLDNDNDLDVVQHQNDPLYRSFISKLIDFFYNPGDGDAGDIVPRQTVVCYLASFVSRASYVCPETVCEVVAALLRWAEAYVHAHSVALAPCSGGGDVLRASNGVEVRPLAHSTRTGKASSSCPKNNTALASRPRETHALFYTACQAAFYIMCFRGYEAIGYYRKALLSSKQQKKDEGVHVADPSAQSCYAEVESVDIGSSKWKFLCGHKYQPLKYCLESVRCEFLNLAEELDLFLEPTNSDGDQCGAENEVNKQFLQYLWRTSSTKEHGSNQDGIKNTTFSKLPRSSTQRVRRRRNIISTAATQEKKRLLGGVGGLGRGSNPLDSFFPFDPYLLQTSYEFVHPYYRNWEDCILTLDDAETEKYCGEKQQEEGAEEGEDDSCLDVSDLGDDDETGEEVDSDSSDEDDVEDNEELSTEEQRREKPQLSTRSLLTEHDNHFEMEIRRSRAMSTGSQCSW